MEKKLYRSNSNKMLAGVCGGLAEYFKVDATLIRVIWAVLSCFGGAGLLAYILCALIIPLEPSGYIDAEKTEDI